MKRLAAAFLLCLLGIPLIASCESPGPRLPAAPAVLLESTPQCRAQLSDAVRELRGTAVALSADAFTENDSVVLSTAGQSASGRMMPPTEILRLQLAPQGCQLQLDGRDRVAALPQCACWAVPRK